jgi:hypothetical protein
MQFLEEKNLNSMQITFLLKIFQNLQNQKNCFKNKLVFKSSQSFS